MGPGSSRLASSRLGDTSFRARKCPALRPTYGIQPDGVPDVGLLIATRRDEGNSLALERSRDRAHRRHWLIGSFRKYSASLRASGFLKQRAEDRQILHILVEVGGLRRFEASRECFEAGVLYDVPERLHA